MSLPKNIYIPSIKNENETKDEMMQFNTILTTLIDKLKSFGSA